MNRRAKLAALQELYDQVPSIDCRGKCANSCGPIDMSRLERTQIAELGVQIPTWTPEAARAWANQERLDCPALGALRQCTVYEARPLICRLWGVVEGMPCVWGCIPERYLSDAEAFELLAKSMQIGGHENFDRDAAAKFAQLATTPGFKPVARDLMATMRKKYG